jgi:hypothetical protein
MTEDHNIKTKWMKTFKEIDNPMTRRKAEAGMQLKTVKYD